MTDQQAIVPVHIGLILDGNRRWATDRNLPALEGHSRGYDNLRIISERAFEKGVKYISAFVFSTENWTRTKDEINYLMQLVLRIAAKDAKQLIENNVRIVMLGVEDKVPKKVLAALRKTEEDSKNNNGGTLAFCFNYGGQQEITDAVKQIVDQNIPPEEITQETVSKNLYHPEIPPIDLLIRTSGEQRISNFMLWRSAYAELYFTDKHWPDFDKVAFDAALNEYTKRNRRFGG